MTWSSRSAGASQWSSADSGARWQDWPSWVCSVCQASNWLNYQQQGKKCHKCGCKRTYVQAVLQGGLQQVVTSKKPQSQWSSPAPHYSWQDYRGAQRQFSVAERLQHLTSVLEAAPGCSPAPAQSESTIIDVEPPPDTAQTSAQMQISALKASLNALPARPEFAQERAMLSARIEKAKQSITESKPTGLRLQGCQDALERAQKKQSDAQRAATVAQDTLAFAQEMLSQADAKVAQHQSELAAIEMEVAQQVVAGLTAPCTASSIDGMAAALSSVVEDMRSSPVVHPTMLQQTETLMTQLLSVVRQVAQDANQAN